MKKIHPKTNKPSKTRIQLKIQSKNVTNNFILTPRTTSALDQKDEVNKQQRFTEQLKSDRPKHDEKITRKQSHSDKKHQHRILTDDHQRIFIKKKIQEDQTRIQTPQIKRISLPTETKYKRKSLNSLTVSDKGLIKNKKKLGPPKLSKSDSGELTKATLQRVIAVVVKDFKEGKIKQKQLEQILIQIYDRRQKAKTPSNKKTHRKDLEYETFSNEFLRSTQHTRRVIKSEALLRKKKKGDEQQLYQGVLQRKGFVNKIIIKGITTSLFLKEDVDLANAKESEAKVKNKQSVNQICTSNSVKEINEDMRKIQQQYQAQIMRQRWTKEDLMAIRIQRAWRQYRTRTLLKKIADPEIVENELDEFTDDEKDKEDLSPKLKMNIFEKHLPEAEEKQYLELVKLVSNSLHRKQISKEECLKSILSFLKGHDQLIKVQEKKEEEEQQEKIEENSDHPESSLNQSPESVESQNVIKISRIKMLDKSRQEEDQKQSSKIDQTPSNELELNSFTNKYSSKDVNEKNQFYAQPMHQSEDFDNSLIFAPSQTSIHETFKMINIHNIEEGLSGREEALLAKKQKQIEELTEKLFNNSIGREKYLAQKVIIQKWYKKQLKELRNIKNALLKTCSQAKKILQLETAIPAATEKSKKMFKCLSDKYIKKENWSICNSSPADQKKSFRKNLHCEQSQQQTTEAISSKRQAQQTNIILNKEEIIQIQWNHNETQVSPRMQRHKDLNEQRNNYKYDQIDKTIQQEDEYHEHAGNNVESDSKFQNEQFIKSIEPYGSEDLEEHEISLINNMINKQNKKFKYLCNEDKEDIFQFLFLDLILEMFTETYVGNQKVQKAAEVYIFKAKRLKKIPKGIKTNLASCKEYMNLLSEYLTQEQNSLKNLSTPMGPSATQMLRYMRDEIVETEDQENIGSTLVLPIQIFQKVGRSKQLELTLERYYEDEEREQNRLAFLKTALHINNKALYDSLNEMLDHQRPYGVWGKPFPWKKTLSIDRKWTKQQQQKKLKKGIDKTIESCSYLCGIMSDKQDSLFGNHRVTEQYIQQIRQDRLSKMLANELFESEERWIFYDDEQTEIQMQVSSFITRKIIKEVVLELVSIRMQQ